MKFTISLDKAKKALATSVVLNGNQIQEVLKNYLIQADERGVLIIGTDLEIALLLRSEADITEQGAVLVDGKQLNDIINYSTGQSLTFETGENNLTISSATGKSVLLTRSTEDYPKIDDFDDSLESVKLPRVPFIAAMQHVVSTVCEDETRRQINAVCIDSSEFISTDGKMVSIFKSTVPFALSNVLIPQKSLAAFFRVLKASSEEFFQFQETKQFYYFKLGTQTLSIRRLNIQFPTDRLRGLVTKTKETNSVNYTVGKVAIVSALERARLTANESRAVFVNCLKDKMELKTADGFGNYSVESLQLKSDHDKEISAFFNWINLLDLANSFSSENIALSFSEKAPDRSPLFLGESTFSAVILPVEMSFNPQAFK